MAEIISTQSSSRGFRLQSIEEVLGPRFDKLQAIFPATRVIPHSLLPDDNEKMCSSVHMPRKRPAGLVQAPPGGRRKKPAISIRGQVSTMSRSPEVQNNFTVCNVLQ